MKKLCQVLRISRSGFYARRARPKSQRCLQNEILIKRIREIHLMNKKAYGSPRIHATLRNEGSVCSINRIARLMRLSNIQAEPYRRYKYRSKFKVKLGIMQDLVQRRFDVALPNHTWASDITSVRTKSGCLHLAVVMDLYSRRIVGWAIKASMAEELSLDALQMALSERQPQEQLIHHSDRGSQYTSENFRLKLKTHGILPSMSSIGDCYDNAVVESFFKSLKSELDLLHHSHMDGDQTRSVLFEYIEIFYNRKRLHSTLGYLSPDQYETINRVH